MFGTVKLDITLLTCDSHGAGMEPCYSGEGYVHYHYATGTPKGKSFNSFLGRQLLYYFTKAKRGKRVRTIKRKLILTSSTAHLLPKDDSNGKYLLFPLRTEKATTFSVLIYPVFRS